MRKPKWLRKIKKEEKCRICYTCEKVLPESRRCIECEICYSCEKVIPKLETRCIQCEKCYACEKYGEIIPGSECRICYTCEKVLPRKNICRINRDRNISLQDLTIFASTHCNLRCKYCFVYFDDFKKEHMTVETGKAAVKFLLENSGKNKVVSMHWFGGEPLINFKMIKEVIEWGEIEARKYNKELKTGATTNCTLLTDEIIEWFVKRKGNLLLSIDGGKDSHDSQRVYPDGRGSWEEAIEEAKKWLKKNPSCTIRFSLHPNYIKNLFRDVQYLRSLGFEKIAISPVYEVEWTEQNKKDYEIELFKLGDLYIEEIRKNNLNIHLKPIEDGLRLFTMKERMKSRCGLAMGSVGVSPDGKIFACHRFVTRKDVPIIGDVFKGWYKEKREEIMDWNVGDIKCEDPNYCINCPIKLRCFGFCLAVNWDMLNNRNIVPKIVCELERIQQKIANYVHITLLGENNKTYMERMRMGYPKKDLRKE